MKEIGSIGGLECLFGSSDEIGDKIRTYEMIKMIDSHRQIYSLRIYEEAVGELTDISLQDGFLLLAQIGKVKLALPACMIDSVKPLLGQRIAILWTDIPNKSYLLRIISTKESHKSLAATMEDSGIKAPSAL